LPAVASAKEGDITRHHRSITNKKRPYGRFLLCGILKRKVCTDVSINNKNMNQKNLWLGTLGLILVVVIVSVLFRSSSPAQPDSTATTPTDQATAPPTSSTGTSAAKPAGTTAIKSALTVVDQKPGQTTLVSSATLEKPGFVVIRKMAIEGRTEVQGEVIGASALLSRGTHSAIVIKAPLSPAGVYYANLYADDGDKVFALSSDQPIKTSTGALLAVRFEANVDVATAAKTYTVGMRNYAFDPATLAVKKGDLVIFTNLDSMVHTVTAGAFGGQHVLDLGKSYTVNTANLARGTYPYRCDYHPNMTGTLIVQ
jgi:plastocyanin